MTDKNPHDIFRRNLALLKKNHPHIHALSPPEARVFKGEIVTLSNGHSAIKLQKTNSEPVILYDQTTNESDTGFVPDDFYGLIYLIGMGMGYTALSLVRQKPDMRFLAIFEPDTEIFFQVLHVIDLTPVLSDPRVLISIGENPDLNRFLAPARNVLMTESLCYRKHLPSFSMNPAYERLSKTVFDYTSFHLISGGTITSYGSLFFRNRLSHFMTMHHHALFEGLKNRFPGKPAILVGAGPSLNKNIQYLKYAKGKAVIIAVDSALPALVHHQVTPDFVTTMDAFDFSYEKIADQAIYGKGVSLICTPTVNVKAPKIFPADHVFWAFTNHQADTWMNTRMGGASTIEGAETVAHLNLFSALIMGCSPIIFVGQDLAYSTSESHAAHTVLSSKNLMENDLKSNNKVVWVKGVAGGSVPTGLAYYNMKRFFEEIIRRNPGPFLNATEGGAHIEGTAVVSLKQVIQEVCVNFIDVTRQVKEAVKESPKRTIEAIWGEVSVEMEKISHLLQVIEEVLQTSGQIAAALSRLDHDEGNAEWRMIENMPRNIATLMMKSEALNNQLDAVINIWEKLTELTIPCLKESERMRHEMTRMERDSGRRSTWWIKREERLAYINQFRKSVLIEYQAHLNKILATYEKERLALPSAGEGPGDAKRLFDLAIHYFNQGELMLAKSIFEGFKSHETYGTETAFYLGAIALNHSAYEEANTYFERARSLDAAMADKEKRYTATLAENYFEYSLRPDIDKAASRRLLVKGLGFASGYGPIIEALKTQFDDDFKNMEEQIQSRPDEAILVINSWIDDFSSYPELKRCFNTDRMGELYALYGRALMGKGAFEDAERKFSKAIEHDKNNAYLHALIADAYFAQDKYNLGVMHLNKAVEIDRAYAACWEDIGGALFEQQQYGDALSAFEMCFKFMPEKNECLKKMGECYEKLGQPEAAEEAYRHYRRLSDAPQ